MAKQTLKNNTPYQAKSKTSLAKNNLFEKIELWFTLYQKSIFIATLALSTLFSLLLFDAKVSLGGDDSSYIERAWLFLNEGKYPYFQGPGYPVFLSLFVKFFGLNVIALKFVSVFCQLGFVSFTYFTFRNRIPNTVLFALLFFISFNSFFQYYASQTFTETFFLFIQSVCFYVIFKSMDSSEKRENLLEQVKNNYKNILLFGFCFVLLTISKSIAFVTIAGIVLYFLSQKKFSYLFWLLISYGIMRLIYYLATTQLFGANDTDQLEMMLRKDLYKPDAGHENFDGMVERFFNNFNTYISLHMYRIMNLRSFEYDASKILPPLSYLSTLALGAFTIMSYKKNKFVFFSSIYAIVLCGGIFLGVQANNMQDRLIIIAMPALFLVMFFGAYELCKKTSSLQQLFIGFATIMLLVTIGKSSLTATQNITALKKNMQGDIYYGYTPDWENFLKMSKYCADSLKTEGKILSRKPAMSFIYGNGKRFVGQFWTTSENADTVLNEWRKQNVEYVILPMLRMNPKKNNGRFINNIHRMIIPVYQKYPQKLKLVKTIGENEKCELYQLLYDK
jgi:hypothetical protein